MGKLADTFGQIVKTMKEGDEILIFNGLDGEWLAKIECFKSFS